jgi:hypothetical protein
MDRIDLVKKKKVAGSFKLGDEPYLALREILSCYKPGGLSRRAQLHSAATILFIYNS